MTNNNYILNLLDECFQSISYKHEGNFLYEIRNNIFASPKDDSCIFQIWEVIEEQIGKYFKQIELTALIELRKMYIEKIILYEKNRLDSIFKKSSESGWQEWIILMTSSITKFRNTFQSKFCEFEFPFPNDKVEIVNNIKKAVKYIEQRYWAGTYKSIEYLSDLDFISIELKIELLVILGEIHQFHFYKPYKTEKFFSRAEKIFPDHYRVMSSWGKFMLEQGRSEEAKEYFSKLLHLYPNKASGYIYMGEITEKENGEAEIWFQNAIKYSPGEIDGYIELAKYYIRKKTGEINELIERILLISPESEYELYIELGYEYQKAHNYEEPLRYYNKALNLDINKRNAYTSIGFLFIDINYKQNIEKARYYFEKVLELFPDFVESHLNMAYTYEVVNNWPLAIDHYEKCPDGVLEYQDRVFAAKGEAYRHLKEFNKAELEFKSAFEYDKVSPLAKIYMENLAQDYYQQKDDIETAVKLYDVILKNMGESYKGDYHNSLGNMQYYFNNNQEAVEQYQKAIELLPRNPVFHRNLSGAYQELKEYEKAIYEIEKAFNIDSDIIIKNQKLANIHNAKGNDLFLTGKYADAISEYTVTIKLVPNNDIYFSNLAGAYEHLKDTASRIESFNSAICYYQKAWDINPKEEYINNINNLKTKKECIKFYGEKAIDKLPIVNPISIEVAGNLIPLVESIGGSLSPHFQETINLMRDGLQFEIGHKKIPGILVRSNEFDLADGTYIIMINEIPLVSGNVNLNKIFVDETVDRLQLLDIKGEEAINPANGSECAWIPYELKGKAENAKLITWDTVEYMILHLSAVIRKNFAEFLTIQDTTEEIELKASSYYQEIQNAPGGIVRFTDVLKILVEEDVPIKELESICKVYLERKDSPIYEIVEELRYHEKIRPLLVGNRFYSEFCNVYQLGGDIYSLINNGIFTNGDAALLALEPEPTQNILTAIRNEVSNLAPTTLNPVIMTEDWKIRRHVRKLVELDFPYLAVMSKREIIKKVQTLATIKLE